MLLTEVSSKVTGGHFRRQWVTGASATELRVVDKRGTACAGHPTGCGRESQRFRIFGNRVSDIVLVHGPGSDVKGWEVAFSAALRRGENKGVARGVCGAGRIGYLLKNL